MTDSILIGCGDGFSGDRDPSQFNRQSVPLKQHNNFVHIEWD